MENPDLNRLLDNALNDIDSLNSLNVPQRQTVKDNINHVTTLESLAQELQKAKELNDAMKAMRDSIMNQEQIRKIAIILMKT